MNTAQTASEILQVLEPMIRQIVRDEMNKAIQQFELSADSPLYADMQDIAQRKQNNQIKLKSHAEVWDD